MTEAWTRDAQSLTEYHAVQYKPGREYILRMTTGADVWLAIQQFAIDNSIRFAKIHAAFMGGLQPARFLVWAPDTSDPSNWHHEEAMEIANLSMILAIGGIIHVRQLDGREEPFPAMSVERSHHWWTLAPRLDRQGSVRVLCNRAERNRRSVWTCGAK